MAAASPGLTSNPVYIAALAMTVGVGRQLRREWTASGLHRALLGGTGVQAFAIRAHDLRPADREAGARILGGAFTLAGATLQVGAGGDPWDRASPHERFAMALHRFGWARDLLSQGDAGAAEGLRLYLDWRRVFGGGNAFAWRPDVLERRVFNLACAGQVICAVASEAETAQTARDLYRQARHLLAVIEGPERRAEQSAAAALAAATLAGDQARALRDKALSMLVRALPHTVDSDGGHASRSPQAALELLFDLRALDEALLQRGVAAPEELSRAIDRLSGAVRFFTLADGALPTFQGGEALSRTYVAAARTIDEDEGGPRPIPASRNGYQRMDGKSLQVVLDAAPPASGPFSVTACAQPLAMEVLAGGRRLITNCGWTPDAAGPAALRLIDAASTATVGDGACGEPLRGLAGALLGPRLTGADAPAQADRRESDEALWLEASHDGWLARWRLQHRRRIFLDLVADEIRGEDSFHPMGQIRGRAEAGRRFVPVTVCFHVHPGARASLAMDKKSVLLRVEGQETGWWLRNDAGEVTVEPSIYFNGGQPRRSQRIVLHGQARVDMGARLRWKLARAELRAR